MRTCRADQLLFGIGREPREVYGHFSCTASLHPITHEVFDCNFCVCPHAFAAGNINCLVTVVNTGTVRLKNIELTEATPLAPTCSAISVLAPGENSTCEVQLAVDQTHYDAEEAAGVNGSSLTLGVTATGASNVSSAALTFSNPVTQFTGLRLPVNRLMSAVASVNPTGVTLTGKLTRRCSTSVGTHCVG